jgi:Flp pilus assembly protein TadG
MTLTPTRSNHPAGQQGSATVELLLVAVGLLAFTAGLMGIGRLTDTRAALAGVAREAARAAADTATPAQAIAAGRQRARLVAAGYGLDPTRLQITVDPKGLPPGGTLTVIVSYRVPLDDLPTLRLLPTYLTLTARQLEPIDPHKSR